MSKATQPNGLTNSTNANIICDCKSKCARKKGRGVCPCKSAGKTCSPSCNCSFEKCQNKDTATENRPERKSASQPEAQELQLFTAEVRLPATETQKKVLEIITAMANRETQENLCRSEVTSKGEPRELLPCDHQNQNKVVNSMRARTSQIDQILTFSPLR